MLIRTWLTHQGPSIRGTLANRVSLRKRGKRSEDLLATYKMKYVNVVTHFDDSLTRFAKRLPPRLQADAMLTRVLRFAADRSPLMGEIAIEPERWGSVVLRTDWADVSRADGLLVYEAMMAERIGIPATDAARQERIIELCALVKHAPIFDANGCVSGYVSQDEQDGNTFGSCNPTPASAPAPASAPEPSHPPKPPGGSPSASPHNGTARPETAERANAPPASDDRPLATAEREGVLAACGALIGQKDIDPSIRQRAKEVDRNVRSGAFSPAAVRDFVRLVVMARKEARIAFLAASRSVA